jgi:hypothetical protein
MGPAGLRARLFILTLLGAAIAPGIAAADGCSDPAVTVKAEAMSDEDIQVFEKTLRSAIAKVCAWWGPAFAGPYTVSIEDSRGPSMALVPAWQGKRGQMLFRSRPVRQGRAATIHEVVHVFAPNANRFLAEGLAVYAHEHLGGAASYPNFGKDLHATAASHADGADLQALDGLATPKRLELDNLDGAASYMVAGSFVRYLIETHGMEKFRALYALTPIVPHERIPSDPARWETVYGKPLAALAAEWKAFIARQ